MKKKVINLCEICAHELHFKWDAFEFDIESSDIKCVRCGEGYEQKKTILAIPIITKNIKLVDEILEAVALGENGCIYVKTPNFDVQFPMIHGNDKDVEAARLYLRGLGFRA